MRTRACAVAFAHVVCGTLPAFAQQTATRSTGIAPWLLPLLTTPAPVPIVPAPSSPPSLVGADGHLLGRAVEQSV
jgi:hypothetical protein